MGLTGAELICLEALKETYLTTQFIYPAALGVALTGGMKKDGTRQLKAQGLGRIGGSMGARLVRMGLAISRDRGYAISGKGYKELKRG